MFKALILGKERQREGRRERGRREGWRKKGFMLELMSWPSEAIRKCRNI